MLYLMVFFIFMAVVFALIGLIKSFSTRNLYVERLHAVMGSVEANKRGEKLTMKATLASLLKSVSQLLPLILLPDACRAAWWKPVYL